MKCPEIYAWLLISRSGEGLPVPVRRHLRACGKCRRRRRRLVHLEQELNPVAATDAPVAKQLFLAKLQHLPGPMPFTASPPTTTRRLSRLLPVAAALLAGLGLGWAVSSVQPPSQQPIAIEPPRVSPRKEEELVARFVNHNLSLSESVEPTEQITLLSHMATDLRAEAFRLARQGQPENLPLVNELYGRVVNRGVVGRWFSLPAAERRELLPNLLKNLQATQAEIERTAQAAPAPVADLLRPLTSSTETAARDLRMGVELLPDPDPVQPPHLAASPGSAHALLAVLVTQGLLLAEEEDPIRRAYHCNAVADELSSALLLASTRGDGDHAMQLGKHLDAVMQRGVTGNLKRVSSEDAAQVAEVRQVIQRASRAVEALESGLARRSAGANPRFVLDAAQYGQVKDLEKALKDLEKALRTANKERKDKGKGKGKGKEGKEIKAVIHSIDPTAETLTVLLRDKERDGEKMTLRIAAAARINQGASEMTLTDLKPDMRVKLVLGEGGAIVELKVEGKNQ